MSTPFTVVESLVACGECNAPKNKSCVPCKDAIVVKQRGMFKIKVPWIHASRMSRVMKVIRP